MVSLTPLGTRAMRQRMLAEGREAGLVGELVGGRRQVLGTVAEQYTPDHGGGDRYLAGRPRRLAGPAVQAIRDCSFLSPAGRVLKTLVSAVPEETSCWPACCATRSSGGRPARGKTRPQA